MSICEKYLLEELQNEYGGSLFKHGSNTNRKVWSWQLSSGKTYEFLEDMVDYLRIKKDQAIVALYILNESEKGTSSSESLLIREKLAPLLYQARSNPR